VSVLGEGGITTTADQARERITQVFRYLRDLNIHRNPAKRLIQDQPWRLSLDDLPDHPSIQRVTIDTASDGGEDGQTTQPTYLLKVDRPRLSKPPTPPEDLLDWLERGWDDPLAELRVRPSRNEMNAQGDAVVAAFENSAQRVALLDGWKPRRTQWAENERPARQAMGVFEELYELRGRIDREGEAVELMIGDGVLDWPRADGKIHHPILLQRVELQFEPDGPSFSIVETERGPELYTALLQSLPDLDTKALGHWQTAMNHENYHPLGDAVTSAFLRNIVVQLGAQGEFVDGAPIRGELDRPRVGRAPVVFLRQRVQGFAMAIEAVLEDLQNRDDLPSPLLRIVGIGPDPDLTEDSPTEVGASAVYDNEVEEILLSKPANPEQVRIVRQLEHAAGVLVQGPPGTGKSHTIANLIGHLLADGKTVLVTAHTTKALRVLRGYVADALQALCVSVLDNDLEGRRQLEQSVEGIVERLSGADGGRLRREAIALGQVRKDLIDRIRRTRHDLLMARQSEYQPIVVDQESFPPSDAARKVTRERETHAWIPAPVTPGAPLPLSELELADLYRTNAAVSREDEAELAFALPDPALLITPPVFADLVVEREGLSDADRNLGVSYWERPIAEEQTADLELLVGRLEPAVAPIGKNELWRLEVIAAGQHGGSHREPWDSLLTLIEDVNREAAEAQETLLRYGPSLSNEMTVDEAHRIAGEIVRHLKGGRSLGGVTLLVHPPWRRLLAAARVGGKELRLPEHFAALRAFCRLQLRRRQLIGRWERQMVTLGVQLLATQGQQPEREAGQWVAHVRECLAWQSETWTPIEAALGECGFRWGAFLAAQPVNASPAGDLLRLCDTVRGALLEVFAARIRAIRWRWIEVALGQLQDTLATYGADEAAATVLRSLREAAARLEPVAYELAFQRLIELRARRSELERRRGLLARLSAVAPGWAAAIQNRVGPHGDAEAPRGAAPAWVWRQLHDELERRASLSLRDLERQLDTMTAELRRTTADLIDRQAWSAQGARVGLRQRQALIGWADTVRRIGRGTGRRAPQLRIEAVRLMNECRSAVPVWIMPLARVVEQFDPRTARFDVVIVDEASQSDVMALVAWYLGKKVVVVGDHEQVSPLAVGQDLDVVQRLIATHLGDIPNRHLYDGRMSVYDLGRQSFGQTIVLVEHFRCVPEIIQFSNGLSYHWRIRPLRDASHVILKPHVVPFRVQASRYGREINYDEAAAIASLIVAAVEQPEYAGKTFGVITLVGEAQALEIERLLRQRLPVAEFERRRIVCGNAAHFQGDERDVMFLSMVDAPEDGPLHLRQDDRFKQRYNVAASRARDQMWVVYSVDPRLDLKPGDLRRELIEHAEDPSVKVRSLQQVERRAESELERQVLRYLVQSRFRVRPQWQVGHYRIDMVVEGDGRRLAIECDGDRGHPPEKLAEDLERQAILERLGWTFVRVRGTEFFRHPDQALQPVFEMLERLEIPPLGPDVIPEEPTRQSSELLSRVLRRADELRREWLDSGDSGSSDDVAESAIGASVEPVSADLSPLEERVLEALRVAGRPLGKSEILARARIPEPAWWTTIATLRRRGVVIQEGTRRGATYQLAVATP
jgi:very-short-patch-repair endonuclease